MLEGRIVNLRAREMADLERNTRWVNDREVMRFMSVRYPMSALAEEQRMRDRMVRPMTFADTPLAIETKDGEHIGNTSLFNVSPEDRTADFGIMIGEKACWSKGYGSDATRTLLRFAFDEMNLHRVWLTVLATHERGIACYRRCGFREEARLRQDVYRHGQYYDFITMGILRNEFEALHGAEGGSDA